MRLYEEAFSSLGASELIHGARCDFFPFGGGYFQAVKRLGELTENRVEIRFRSAVVEVLGEGLAVKKYCEGDLWLSGKITAVKVVDGDA